MYNLGYSIEDIYLLVDEDFASDPDFPRVLGYVANSIQAGQPLDEIQLDDLLSPIAYADFGDFDPLPVNDDPRHGLKDRTKHQLVILIHGMGGTNTDGDAGMNAVYSNIFPDVAGGHILRLESGHWAYPTNNPTLNADLAFSGTNGALDQIDDTIAILGNLGHDIDSVVIAGHSWGGGMAKRVANYIDSEYPDIEIAGLVYVDAVAHGLIAPESGLPSSVSSFLNIYQSENDAGVDFLNGVSISNPGLAGFDGTAYYGRYREFNVDGDGENEDHAGIDNNHAGEVADFIVHVLDEWYWNDYITNNL